MKSLFYLTLAILTLFAVAQECEQGDDSFCIDTYGSDYCCMYTSYLGSSTHSCGLNDDDYIDTALSVAEAFDSDAEVYCDNSMIMKASIFAAGVAVVAF